MILHKVRGSSLTGSSFYINDETGMKLITVVEKATPEQIDKIRSAWASFMDTLEEIAHSLSS